MTGYRLFAVSGLLAVGIAGSAVGQNTINAGTYPAGNYQWRIDTDPATAGYQIARRVTGAAGSTFDINIRMANIPASPPAREFLFTVYYDPSLVAFSSLVGCLPGFPPVPDVCRVEATGPNWVSIFTQIFACGGWSGDVIVATLRFSIVGATGVTGLDVKDGTPAHGGNSSVGDPTCGAAIGDTTGVAKAVVVVDPNGASTLSALTVNNTGNAGSCNIAVRNPDSECTDATLGIARVTLRSALEVANAAPGNNRVTFFVVPNPGLATITNPLMPQLTDAAGVHVDGTTQLGQGVEVKGPGVAAMGFDIVSSANIIQALTINNFTGAANAGVRINGNNNTVKGCKIGTNTAGNAAIANGRGVYITGSANNTIGGNVAGARNVISGNNADGIEIATAGASGNLVQGNYIGTNLNGNGAVPNGLSGIYINGAPNNTVGIAGALGRNVISGNLSYGVDISGAGASGNLVKNNYIGLDAAGAAAIPNRFGGIFINGAPSNTIGGAAGGDENVISRNGIAPAVGHGVLISLAAATGNIVQNNRIGLNAAGNAALGNLNDGVRIDLGAHDNTVGGTPSNYISGNLGDGIHITGAATSGIAVFNNGIGVNVSGAGGVAMGNLGIGVHVSAGAHDNHIGGNFIARNVVGNVICNNAGDGVQLNGAVTNEVRANTIGQNASGVDQPNTGNGVSMIAAAFDNTVVGNSIYANLGHGVFIDGAGTDQNVVSQNFIGAAAHGNALDGVHIGNTAQNNVITVNDIGNNGTPGNPLTGNGVHLADDDTSGNLITANQLLGNLGPGVFVSDGANLNVIGGDIPAAANTMDGNLQHGVRVLLGFDNSIRGNIIRFNNLSGVNVVDGTGNEISRNSIFSNNPIAGLGIDLNDPLGVTPNDAGDGDGGGNGSQNFPVLTSAVGGTVNGTFNSAANRTYRLEFFSNTACDASGFGEGESFLGSMNVTTDGQGDAAFAFIAGVPAGVFITSTATDLTPNPIGPANDTSEFSACIQTLAVPPPAPCDLNCDGTINGLDIAAFALAVIDPAQYAILFPACNILNGDCNGDGFSNFPDTTGFVECVLAGDATGVCPP